MNTGPGRPPTPEAQRVRTKLVRLPEDIADKLAEVVEAEGTTSAEYLDPLLRTQIENDHRANADAIKALRRARERARKAREQAVADPPGGEG